MNERTHKKLYGAISGLFQTPAYTFKDLKALKRQIQKLIKDVKQQKKRGKK